MESKSLRDNRTRAEPSEFSTDFVLFCKFCPIRCVRGGELNAEASIYPKVRDREGAITSTPAGALPNVSVQSWLNFCAGLAVRIRFV